MKILRIGLIDDETPPRLLLSEIISMIPGYTVEFSTDDPQEALTLVLNNKVDILITDIMMPGLGGIELSKRIAHMQIPVIICSAHDKFGVEGFRLNAVHFVIKPPSPYEVSEALTRARKLVLDKSLSGGHSDDLILIKEHGDHKQLMIKPAEILFMEQKERFTYINMESGKSIKTLSKFFATLEKIKRPYILKIHRSFAINFLKIEALEHTICYLEGGSKVPIGKEYKDSFNEYLRSKTIV